jgi:hypothetical protein
MMPKINKSTVKFEKDANNTSSMSMGITIIEQRETKENMLITLRTPAVKTAFLKRSIIFFIFLILFGISFFTRNLVKLNYVNNVTTQANNNTSTIAILN